MTIQLAILGFLTSGPMSGYDLKKAFAESDSLHWSGNNNQIYRALVELHQDGMATKAFEQSDEGPPRKLYAITDRGRDALKAWLVSEPELPVSRIPILARLIAADLLDDEELDQLLAAYAEQVRLKLAGLEELQRRGKGRSFGSLRQRFLWESINNRPIALFKGEEAWVRELRWELAKLVRRQRL